ncbi:MAG: hypothetical protein NT075_25525, partial [Chloroflexi bacterium]|nr:hypothetical protein [Chloroflexota bacterium]
MAIVHTNSRPPYVSSFLWVSVDPAYLAQGLGTMLTEWGETRLRERIADAPPDARVVARCGT